MIESQDRTKAPFAKVLQDDELNAAGIQKVNFFRAGVPVEVYVSSSSLAYVQ